MNNCSSRNEKRIVFLDGIRGWAAVAVLYSHLCACFLAPKYTFLQSKLFSFVTDGNFAVYIFFVLSGMALSVNFFRSNDQIIVRHLFARRYLRLFVPIAASTLLGSFLLRTGLFYNVEAANLMGGNPWLGSFFLKHPSMSELFKFISWDVFFNGKDVAAYNAVLWTMRVEFLGSLFVFSLCLLILPLKKYYIFMIPVAIYVFANDFFPSFFLGMFLAKVLDKVIEFCDRPESEKYCTITSFFFIFSSMFYATFSRAFVFDNPIILRTNPRTAFFAFLFILSVIMNLRLRCLFSTKLSQYLGAISFPLYLTHLLIICSFSSYLYTKISHMNSLFVLCIIIPTSSVLAFWVAARFYVIEKIAIKISRKFSNFILVE
ncbi:acyltransferase 3 [Desulfovibrio sp. X2]|uniref:acyltransferase family protein n=1 Tax=Desulfovibrio sp. X2 TaxID=941449 RepID=UPI0003589236|nr:acyltransferase [Desulfovibrio sp. X2]EPR37101.1 acyltransferase 3 [Desulfovibrio sp. X2]